MIHMHITSWVLGLILVIVAATLLKNGNQKGYKISHMILRVVYLLIIGSGADMLFRLSNISGEYIGKAVLGIIVIGLMEMMLIKKSKGKNATGITIGFVVAFVIIVALGLRLPMGWDFF